MLSTASDELWAKSPAGGAGRGESLVEHTAHVVRGVAALRERSPFLTELAGEPRLWAWLGLAAALHDLGKADPRFQRMLREPRVKGKPSSYDQRHEVVSLAWLDWAFQGLPADPRMKTVLAAVIATHHKDHGDLLRKYDPGTEWAPTTNIDDLIAPISSEVWSPVAEVARQEIEPIVRATGLLPDDWPGFTAWSDGSPRAAVASVTAGLCAFDKWYRNLEAGGRKRLPDRVLGILVRGVMMLADHTGSAHRGFGGRSALEDFAETRQRLAPPKEYAFHPHQVRAGETVGHALLVAPTGSGKTEAALLWTARQMAEGQGRPPLFYVLPFKASLNAMRERIRDVLKESEKGLSEEDQNRVVLQHSSAMQVLYFDLMNRDDSQVNATAEETAKRVNELGRLHTAPVRVLSPYQLLRAAYGLKGYEAILADAAGGLFVFDEIHAYEIGRLAQILGFTRYLVEQFGARVFVMTATMPAHVRGLVETILGQPTQIRADDATYGAFKRHRLKLVEGGLLDDSTVEAIVARAKSGESVLCVATTVGRAQELRAALSKRLPGTDVGLLHSRFTGKDRSEKELSLKARISTSRVREGGARKAVALVATQVVEVSLDVDFDVLFSDAAPIEALVQRFGRVNRGRRGGTRDVFVCTRVEDADCVYDKHLLLAAVEQLRSAVGTECDGIEIDERNVQMWLDGVYSGETLAWFAHALRDAADQFQHVVLDALIPFGVGKDLEDQFYEMFDGAEVLPRSLLDEYKAKSAASWLEASSLLVPVSQRQLRSMFSKGQVAMAKECGLSPKGPLVVDVPYDSDVGLQVNPRPNEDRG